jgi:hypothetical protein
LNRSLANANRIHHFSDKSNPEHGLLLDMRVIFAGISAGLRDLPSVETAGSAMAAACPVPVLRNTARLAG